MRQPPGTTEIVLNRDIDSFHPRWQEQARCSGVGSDYFFGYEDAPQVLNISMVRRASKLCEVCPVFRECITHALVNKEQYGIWAGTTGKVRKHIRRMINRGEVTIEEVVEDYCHGATEKYRPQPDNRRRRAAQTSSADEGGGRVSARNR
jgi:WhiB family redox-sensing transcriptional regulator